jgi:hypothetical protein
MSEKDKPKWDGRSRPTNDLYKKNYDEIFKEDEEEYTPEELKEEQELADFADKFKEKEDKHEVE